MSHVFGPFLADLLSALERRGLPIEPLLAGLALDRAGLESRTAFVDWDSFVTILERLETEVGGPKALEAIGESASESHPVSALRRLAGLAASPHRLIRAGERWALRRAIPLLRNEIHPLEPRRLKVISEIPQPHRGCPQLFHLAVGALRAMPTVLDLPAAIVESSVTARRGEYIVTLPASGTLWAKLQRAGRAVFSARAAFEQLERQQLELESRFADLRAEYGELAQREALSRARADATVDLTIEISNQGRIEYLSPSVTELTGHLAEDACGTPITNWIHSEDIGGVLEQFQRMFQIDAPGRPVFRVRHRDGHWIWLEVEGRTFEGGGGEKRAALTLRDVTQRMQQDQERESYQRSLEADVARQRGEVERLHRSLREMQAMILEIERSGEGRDVAGQVAHSINNPLCALIGRLQLQLLDSETPELGRILELANRVGKIVNGTLALYREGTIQLQTEAAEDILADLREELSLHTDLSLGDQRIEFETELLGELPPLSVDRPLLVSAIASVVANAIEAMPDGGTLRVEAEAGSEGKSVLFRVLDTGPGVEPELLERIFEPRYSSKPDGTGLGLSMARAVVAAHGGSVSARRRTAGGMCFILEIPFPKS